MTDDVKLPEPDRRIAEDDPMYGVIGADYYEAATVRRLIAEAVEREREACAALCVKIERAGGHGLCPASGFTFAASIRNRSKA